MQITPPAHVSGILLRVLADVVSQYGVDLDEVFAEHIHFVQSDIDPLQVRIPLAQFRRLLRRAVSLTGEPAIGLHCGLNASGPTFDLFCPLIRGAQSLRRAIQLTQQFHSLAFEGVTLRLYERGSIARLRWSFPREDEASDRTLAELLAGCLVRITRKLDCRLHVVRFEHGEPEYAAAYTTAFAGLERFAQVFTGIEIDARLLDRPRPKLPPDTYFQAMIRAETHLAKPPRASDVANVLERHLLAEPMGRIPSMSTVAQELGVSPRTLRRRLSESGHTYRSLAQRLRLDRATGQSISTKDSGRAS